MRALLPLLLFIAVPASAEPAMWVVKSATTEITLFGSIHALPPGTVWLTPAVAARLDAADTVVLETLLPEDQAGLAAMIQQGVLPPAGVPLAKRLPAAQLKALTAAETSLGLPPAALARFKTWLIALTVGAVAAQHAGFDPANGVEKELTARARAGGKALIGLERPAEQIGFFDALAEADQQALLTATVKDLPTETADLTKLAADWVAGKPEGLAADADLHATPALERALLTNRNARWADWIAGVMKRPGKVFIAVGAAHLSGDQSVLALLAAKGLTAERVR